MCIRDRLADANAETILAGAVPFPGKWLDPPRSGVPRAAAMAMVENGYHDEAVDYIKQLLPMYETMAAAESDSAKRDRLAEAGSLHRFLAAIRFDQRVFDEALDHYQKALVAAPNNAGTLREIARTHTELGNNDAAGNALEQLVELQPKNNEHLATLASLRLKQERVADAIALYERALAEKFDPRVAFEVAKLCERSKKFADAIRHYGAAWDVAPSPVVGNNLAWLLATVNDDELRDGDRAVEVATKAVEMTRGQVPEILSTLAAAQAEAGDFVAAVDTTQKAIELAKAQGKPPLVEELEKSLKLFEGEQPYRAE